MLAVDHDTWSVASAKNKLSEVIERAQHLPQVITCHGRPSAVVVSVGEWTRKLSRKNSLVDFLKNSPLGEEALALGRIHDAPRGVDL